MNVVALNPRSTGGVALHPRTVEPAGFHAPKKFSPTGLGVVIALHLSALTAVALIKTPEFIRKSPVITEVFNIPIAQDPPPVPPPPAVERQQPRPSVLDRPETVVDTLPVGPAVSDPPDLPPQRFETASSETGTGAAEMRIERAPVRIDAAFDPRVALQPPYPSSELRAQREGDVRVRVTIGADGRVTAVERLSATSDAFWRATERYALSRWRFRPATLDGRPVESSKVLNLHFEITA